ncbi:MAG: menaquinone biosynthetic enzyme MqnA/MqnD family protein [Acidobacteriota bacterium]
MPRTRIASVWYLNALPLTWGLMHGSLRDRVDVVQAPPCDAARLLREDLVDVALLPSIEFPRNAGFQGIPGTGISARGKVRSVLLLSRVEPGAIRSLGVDRNSRTSVALARLILKRCHGCTPAMTPMDPDLSAMLHDHDGALLIGDPALRASCSSGAGSRGLHVLDLAGEWNLLTGLPFVFAFWACRPTLSPVALGEILSQSLEEGLANIDKIAAQESSRVDLPEQLIASYLRCNLQYRLGSEESESLRVFYGLCREEGILPGYRGGGSFSSRSVTSNKG